MAEEAKKQEGEDKNLNPEGGQPNGTDGGDQKGNQGDKTTFTLEEVEAMKKEMASNSDKGVQKLLRKQELMEKALDAVPKISDDPSYLVTLHDTEPDVAETILRKFYNGKTIEKYMEDEGIELDMSDPEIVKKRIESEARKLADKRIMTEKSDAFIEELKMTADEKEAFQEALSERMELKSFRMIDMRKHMEKAYLEISPDSEEGRKKLWQAEAIGKALATGTGKDATTSPKKNPLDKSRSEAKSFLSKFNL